jgi:protein TonB
MPEFPGGDAALLTFFKKNMNTPRLGIYQDIRSDFQVRFIVNEDGSVSEIKVVKSISPAVDEEAIRVLKQLPRFKPGYKDEQPVRVYFNLPIIFDWK